MTNGHESDTAAGQIHNISRHTRIGKGVPFNSGRREPECVAHPLRRLGSPEKLPPLLRVRKDPHAAIPPVVSVGAADAALGCSPGLPVLG